MALPYNIPHSDDEEDDDYAESDYQQTSQQNNNYKGSETGPDDTSVLREILNGPSQNYP